MRADAPAHIEVLLSTMRMNDYHPLATALNINSDCLIINQGSTEEPAKSFIYNTHAVRVFQSAELGLSKSRNLAIENAVGDVCLFADDDMTYSDDYVNIVQTAYKKLPAADVVVFNFKGDVEWRNKKLGLRSRKLGYLDCLKVSSVMISFRRNKIVDAGIRFNELFGAGSEFPSGEENIFLFDCLKKGLKIYYYPTVIASVRFQESSWLNSFNTKYFYSKGALGYMLFNNFYWLFIFQFALRKYALYRKDMGVISAIRHMMSGQRYCSTLLHKVHANS